VPLELKRPVKATAIGLVPLIDVVFILLLFFMLATNFQRTGVVELEAAGENIAGTQSEAKWIFVRVGVSDIRVDDESVSVDLLGREVQTRLAQRSNAQVLVSAPDEVAIQRVVTVMDGLRNSGIRRASFSVQ